MKACADREEFRRRSIEKLERELAEQGIDPSQADPSKVRRTWRLIAALPVGERS